MTRSSFGRLATVALVVALLAACGGATVIEADMAGRLDPDPATDPALRLAARTQAQSACTARRVSQLPYQPVSSRPSSLTLVDRERVYGSQQSDVDRATAAISQRFQRNARLDEATWERMGSSQLKCADGYLYASLVLQNDGGSGWASGVQRITAANGGLNVGGASTRGLTVFTSTASNIVPGTTDNDLYVFDPHDDSLKPMGINPKSELDVFQGSAISGDGQTLYYAYRERINNSSCADYCYSVNGFDLATRQSKLRYNMDTTPTSLLSAGAGDVLVLTSGGAGGTTVGISDPNGGSAYREFYDGYPDVSLSADGRFALFSGLTIYLLDRSSNRQIPIRNQSLSDNRPLSGTALSGDGRFAVYNYPPFEGPPEGEDGGQDLYIWDRNTGVSTRLTSNTDGLSTYGSPSISDDGRFVVYGYGTNTQRATYLLDVTNGSTTKIAPEAGKAIISGDGKTVALQLGDLFVWSNPAA